LKENQTEHILKGKLWRKEKTMEIVNKETYVTTEEVGSIGWCILGCGIGCALGSETGPIALTLNMSAK
jgi:hypothetical protein